MDSRTSLLTSTEIFYLLCLGLDNDDDYVSSMTAVNGWTSLSV